MAKSTDVAKVAAPVYGMAVLDDSVPAYLREEAGKGSGLTGLSAQDLRMPRIKLLQGTSEECTTFDDAKPGIFWHSLLDKSLGKEIEIIICARNKKYLLMTPINDPRGVLARADDGVHWDKVGETFEVTLKGQKEPVKWTTAKTVVESGLDQFGSSDPENADSPPAATLFYDYLILVKGVPGAVAMSLARSAAKVAKDLNSKIEMQSMPVQAMSFKVTPKQEEGPEGPFFNWRFTLNGFVDEPDFKFAREITERFKDFTVADEASAAGDVDASEAGGVNENIAAEV